MGVPALIAGAVASAAVGAFASGMDDDPPEISTTAPESQQIANRIPPINFASIIDTLSGDNLDIIRGTDGRVALTFGNNLGRVDLDRPVDAGNINVNLPAVRQIRGRNIDERAVEVVALSQAMTRLGGVIEQMERTSPYLIAQNQDLINSYRTAVSSALDRGFDFKQQSIDQKLTKMGLINSSTSFGVQVALAREKANAYAEMELKQAELAQGLKQQAIGNLHKRGEQLNQQANTELNRFGVETSNQLQVRSQDMQADLATQQLEQQRASAQAALQLQANQQRIGTEFGNRQLTEGRRNRMLAAGADLFNQGTSHAIGARSVENTAIANNNYQQLQQYSMRANPWGEAARTFSGSMLGSIGTNVGNSMLQQQRRAPWSTEIDF
jgi:hypothetical protein